MKQYSNQNHHNPVIPSSLPVYKSTKEHSQSDRPEVVISSPMTPLCRPFPSPPPPPNRKPSRPALNSATNNINSLEEFLMKNEFNQNPKLPFDEQSPLPSRKRNAELSSQLQPATSYQNKTNTNSSGHISSFGKRFLPKTPNSTPFSTPFTKRKNQQMFHQYNQVHNIGSENLIAEPTRKRLVLHNKSPMWNEASQVYQLDFGGRVTQESAKNFQIEYKGKQVIKYFSWGSTINCTLFDRINVFSIFAYI